VRFDVVVGPAVVGKLLIEMRGVLDGCNTEASGSGAGMGDVFFVRLESASTCISTSLLADSFVEGRLPGRCAANKTIDI
jgi:hypothetical protein